MSHPRAGVEVGAAARLVRAVRRPASVSAVAREAVGAMVTAALWPVGMTGRMRPGSSVGGTVAGPLREVGILRTPVLLLHGYGANSSYWFATARALRSAGFDAVHGFDCQLLRHDIPAASARCVERAHEVMRLHGADQIHLVGHSAGGIVVRHAVQLDGLHEVSTAVTVAAPHRGAALARCSVGPTARQLRPGSDLLSDLASAPPAPDTRFVSYYSNTDVVVPGRAAMLLEPSLETVHHLVKDVGHLSILFAADFHRSLVEELLVSDGRLVRLSGRARAGEEGSGAGRCTGPVAQTS